MKKSILFTTMLFASIVLWSPVSRATGMPTFDAVNAALNELRNVLMQSQFAQDMAGALERLNQLKAQYLETLRFNSGIDDVISLFNGSSLPPFPRGAEVSDAFWDFSAVVPHFERLENSSGVSQIRDSLEAITGEIPNSEVRAYIPFEEMQVVSGFHTAQEIRRAGEEVRETARSISQQAQTASPKGAARLQADAMSRVLVASQENQEAMAKLIELQATQVEQVSREEKRLESERLKYMSDAKDYISELLGGVS
ncbi:MAG TPA: hypothetical protein PLY88_04150 [Candidatus Omnitrophota bacterium]|nr:hypothetical protein [Candidatus Omnitrophota bacterium]